jgi:hypothetical protein
MISSVQTDANSQSTALSFLHKGTTKDQGVVSFVYKCLGLAVESARISIAAGSSSP